MKAYIYSFFIVIVFSLFPKHGFSQDSVNKTFIGYWSSESSLTKMIFFLDKGNMLQLVSWDANTKYPYEEFVVMSLEYENNVIKSTEKFVSTNWVTKNTFTIVDENKLKCVVGGDGKDKVIFFDRIK